MPDQTIGRYRILGPIAIGGMGTVYRAEDPDLERAVALKVLPDQLAGDPERLSRFQREARALAAVTHPNIVAIYTVEEDDGVHFLTMELVEGHTLAEVIADGGTDIETFFDVAVGLASALEAAHAQGITHRDLKPENVMVTEEGRVKVLDFGLAKVARVQQVAGSGSSVTETMATDSRVIGTPHYMSPEQARGEPVDTRSDIFSMGALLYHLATGHRPFRGTTSAESLASVLRDHPTAAASLCPDCPAVVSRLLDRCLAKRPEVRVASAVQLRRELEEARGMVLAAGERAHSVAVLPFADLSEGQDQKYFCAGIAEEIINSLTKLDGLKVVSRMSSFQYRDLGGDSRDIGRKLGVHSLLEGSVQKSGPRLRIMAQLISVDDGCHIWSQRFDREIEDIFQVQDEIAQSVARALQLAIATVTYEPLVDARTHNAAAYDFYLRGRDFFRRWGKRNTKIAQRMFEQAIERDPEFASAHAGLADTYSYLYMYINSSDENLATADRCSERALELAPALAEAHASRGLALSLRKQHAAAAKAFGTARELDPNLFEAHYFAARNLVVQGSYEEAIAAYLQAAEVSPADYQIPILRAQIHHALGQSDLEEAANHDGMALAEKAILLNPEDARACYMGAGAMIRLGQHERGLMWARRAQALDPDDPAILYNVACSFALLGRTDEAVDCLERTVMLGAAYLDWMMNDSDLDPLRDDPRFAAMVGSLD